MAANIGIGRLDELHVGAEDFDCYIERMEQYFIANDVPENKKVAAFLSPMEVKAYELLRNLVAPDSPKDKRFNDLVKTIRVHLKPKALVIAERFKLYKRVQCEYEMVAEYIVSLKQLLMHCDFCTFLNDALHDQLVCGFCQEAIQRKLLAEDKLTFKKASEIAQAMELAERNATELKATDSAEVQCVSNRHKVVQHKQTQEISNKSLPVGVAKKSHYHCGEQYKPEFCRFLAETCRRCGKKSHIAKKCRSKELIHQVEESFETLNGIYTVTRSQKGYLVDVEINGHKVNMQLDTGAACAVLIILETLYNSILRGHPLTETRPLRSYSGNNLSLLRQLPVKVKYTSQAITLPLVVVKGNKVPLLGRNWKECINLNWSEIFSV